MAAGEAGAGAWAGGKGWGEQLLGGGGKRGREKNLPSRVGVAAEQSRGGRAQTHTREQSEQRHRRQHCAGTGQRHDHSRAQPAPARRTVGPRWWRGVAAWAAAQSERAGSGETRKNKDSRAQMVQQPPMRTTVTSLRACEGDPPRLVQRGRNPQAQGSGAAEQTQSGWEG